jgi:hypothetical protein
VRTMDALRGMGVCWLCGAAQAGYARAGDTRAGVCAGRGCAGRGMRGPIRAAEPPWLRGPIRAAEPPWLPMAADPGGRPVRLTVAKAAWAFLTRASVGLGRKVASQAVSLEVILC